MRALDIAKTMGAIAVLILSGKPADAEPAPCRALPRAAIRDPSLDKVARRLLTGPNPDASSALTAAARAEGVSDATLWTMSPADGFGGDLPAAQRPPSATHVGCAHVGDRARWVLARRLAALMPLPQRLSARLTIRGHSSGPVRAFVRVPSRAHGDDTRALPVQQSDNGHFQIELVPPSRGQPLSLALVTDLGFGPELAHRWTFNDRPDSAPAVAAPPIDSVPALDRAVNALRVDRRLGVLAASPSLRRAAERYAETVCRTGWARHRLPQTASLKERIRRSGYSGQALENLAIARSWSDALKNLLESPSHRHQILSARAREVGHGIARIADRACVVQLIGIGPSTAAASMDAHTPMP